MVPFTLAASTTTPSTQVGSTLVPALSSARPTPTPAPAAVSSTQRSTNGVTAIDGVPLCGVRQPTGGVVGPKHDPTRWHALVERNPDGSILCTYGHDHGSDPHQLDATFGTLAGTLPGGQEIAFPWITSSAENSTDPSSLSHLPSDSRPVLNGKHAFFKWEVLTPAKLAAAGITGCPPNSNAAYGFDSIRMEVHADANAGADIRFHSFYLQARECSTTNASYHGQVWIGGHYDYGILNGTHQDSSGNEYDVRIPLPGIDPCAPGSRLADGATCPYMADRRTHGASAPGPSGSSDPHASLPGAVRNDFTWYGHNGDPDLAGQPGVGLTVSDGVREQDWGPVNPNNPSGPVLFYGPGHDHGWGGIDILDFIAPQPSSFPSDNPAVMNTDGTYTWGGWVNVHGLVQSKSTCQGQPISTTCIPVMLQNMRPGEAQFSNDVTHLQHDVYDVNDANGVSLIAYPN